MKFHPCKVTVVKKTFDTELTSMFLKEPEKMKACNLVEDKQTFLITNPYLMPEKMCASAWADIRSYIITIASGGEFDFMNEPKSALAICSDPFRPVVFKIERI